MEDYIEDLKTAKLFYGIAPYEIEGLLKCIHARRTEYPKGACILEEGSKVSDFGIMLSGHGRAYKEDPWGRQIIITLLHKGSEIGVIVAADSGHTSPVTVQVQEYASVLIIPFERLITRCKNACPQHDLLVRNYIGIVAQKGLVLHDRIDCLLKPTVREKITAYLLRISHERKSPVFSVPLDRNGMAEYLNVDRSALSRELSSMKRDGLIDYHKNGFKILEKFPR
jgi:CRP/FNR family transcriptional regulator, dissimilatory nitrate respiration regulator